MKTRLNKLIGGAALVAVLVVPTAMAEKGSGKGGASKLLPPTVVYAATPTEAMKCASCTDTLLVAPNREVRGAGARDLIGRNEVTVAKHLCGSCGVTFETRGYGKAKRDIPIHTCGDCAAKAKAAAAVKTAAR